MCFFIWGYTLQVRHKSLAQSFTGLSVSTCSDFFGIPHPISIYSFFNTLGAVFFLIVQTLNHINSQAALASRPHAIYFSTNKQHFADIPYL
jgi:hypothetical protein